MVVKTPRTRLTLYISTTLLDNAWTNSALTFVLVPDLYLYLPGDVNEIV